MPADLAIATLFRATSGLFSNLAAAITRPAAPRPPRLPADLPVHRQRDLGLLDGRPTTPRDPLLD